MFHKDCLIGEKGQTPRPLYNYLTFIITYGSWSDIDLYIVRLVVWKRKYLSKVNSTMHRNPSLKQHMFQWSAFIFLTVSLSFLSCGTLFTMLNFWVQNMFNSQFFYWCFSIILAVHSSALDDIGVISRASYYISASTWQHSC